jgi:uncharacterized protein YfaT (DUF1175 family)
MLQQCSEGIYKSCAQGRPGDLMFYDGAQYLRVFRAEPASYHYSSGAYNFQTF